MDPHVPPLSELSRQDLAAAGLSGEASGELLEKLRAALGRGGPSQPAKWQRISRAVLTPEEPLAVHRLLFSSTYRGWDAAAKGPPPAWIPQLDEAAETNLGRFLADHGRQLLGPEYKDPVRSFRALHRLSTARPELYWPPVLRELNIKFRREPAAMWRPGGHHHPGGVWLPGAVLNAAECCLGATRDGRRRDDAPAVVWSAEGRREGEGARSLPLRELRARANRVANALRAAGFLRGDAVAVDMPMTVESVEIYLGLVLAGMVVVSIADSFAAAEIATRVAIARARGIFVQDVVLRGSKALPLYSRVVEAGGPHAIVVPAAGGAGRPCVELRAGDVSYADFLSSGAATCPQPSEFEAVGVPAESPCNILFSSGTTGTPKAIPWSHVTPIKTAADAWAHQDIRSGDIVAWPTSLGWMMGPWLIFAALVNGATVALYEGSPLGRGFGQFVQDAGVTMLGLVPSIVRAWRTSGCMAGLDWSRIRCFSSTGEASSAEDYLWLISRPPGYRPVIEYCGGTEIGGAFATGTLLQPQALAAFSTAAMGCRIVVLNEEGEPQPEGACCVGECALMPAMLGSSLALLNADHGKVYFDGMPLHEGQRLRRHGDELEQMAGGFYRAHGRVDDTMNLGGIKVSSVEIERVCNQAHPAVLETAAIGVAPPGGGPELLLVAAVLREGRRAQPAELKGALSGAVGRLLNPLFKIRDVVIVASLPRTASNKIIRRALREQFRQNVESLRPKL